ncbi:MAG: 4'-phosphopantetheinyl transferase superfamily protein [Bifidobacteriaceae bacterium]|nr:4'-phosphopantetheinyl transferase superfamily protein [Bifidobacteriaceae bacterium]
MTCSDLVVRLAFAPPAPGGGLAGSALARALVERQAAVVLGGRGGPLTWARTESGRPYLIEAPEMRFSISHSGPYVGVVFAVVPCGLDIELSTRRARPALARRFAPDEREYIAAADPAALANDRLLEVWTKKEAYLKWLGVGLGAGLASFSVLDPAALGVGFIGLAPGPRGDLTGHICVDQATARSAAVRQIWED